MSNLMVEDIRPSRVCVGNKDRTAREIIWIKDGQAVYRSFSLLTGEYEGMSSCSVEYLASWAERKITGPEYMRLDFNKAERDEKVEREKVVNPALKWATDAELMDEVKRRGLDRKDM